MNDSRQLKKRLSRNREGREKREREREKKEKREGERKERIKFDKYQDWQITSTQDICYQKFLYHYYSYDTLIHLDM